MKFPKQERAAHLATPMVGPKIIAHLEATGYGSFAKLHRAKLPTLAATIAQHTGWSCWTSSPQSLQALKNVLQTAAAK